MRLALGMSGLGAVGAGNVAESAPQEVLGWDGEQAWT